MNCLFGVWSKGRRNCIAPLENNSTIEIRPSRYLRIQHYNARPRDEKVENEHGNIQYEQQCLSAAGHPLVSLNFSDENHQEQKLEHLNASTPHIKDCSTEHEKHHNSNEETANPDRNTDKDIVIFFIHGVGGSSDVWGAQTRYFSDQGYEIIAPDLIGHGFSYATKEAKAYHFREIAADVEEVFDRYCKKRNVLIGHSYGSSFAALLARNHPRRVTKLILISGGSPTPLMPQLGVFSLPCCMIACIKPCLLCRFYRGAFYNKQKPIIPKEEAFNIPAYVLKHTMNGQHWPDGDELYHKWITCPSLLIYGAKDQLVSLQEEEDMATVIHNSRLEVIPDAGHMVMIEAPEDVNHLIDRFISQPAFTAC